MRALLQHPHPAGEISCVLTFVEPTDEILHDFSFPTTAYAGGGEGLRVRSEDFVAAIGATTNGTPNTNRERRTQPRT